MPTLADHPSSSVVVKQKLAKHIWTKITFASDNSCWEWTGSNNGLGYGQLNVGQGHKELAHRIVFEAVFGEIPKGLVLDHLCKNPRCCNPKHLEAVTQRENILRGSSKIAQQARRTHCPQGHPLEPPHVRIYKGKRVCYTCQLSYRERRKLRGNVS